MRVKQRGVRVYELKKHLVHHRFHMLACAVGARMAVVGGVFNSSVVAILGAVICGGLCIDMVRMMVVMRPKRG
jgi:hypothetical protein